MSFDARWGSIYYYKYRYYRRIYFIITRTSIGATTTIFWWSFLCKSCRSDHFSSFWPEMVKAAAAYDQGPCETMGCKRTSSAAGRRATSLSTPCYPAPAVDRLAKRLSTVKRRIPTGQKIGPISCHHRIVNTILFLKRKHPFCLRFILLTKFFCKFWRIKIKIRTSGFRIIPISVFKKTVLRVNDT